MKIGTNSTNYFTQISTCIMDNINTGQAKVASLLHWNDNYDKVSLAERYIQNGKASSNNIDEVLSNNIIKEIKELKDFDKLNTREIAFFVIAFKDSPENLSKALSAYITHKQKIAEGVNIQAFIQKLQQAQKEEKIDNAIADLQNNACLKQSVFQMAFASIKNAMQEGYIFEPACSIYGYLYGLLPMMEATLSGLTGTLLFANFWAMFCTGILAALSITIVSGLIYGAFNYQEKGLLAGALQGLQEEWNQKVLDDNSFHPFAEAVIGSLYITSSWLYIDKLESSARIGSLIYTLTQYGINNFVWKYLTMNLFFTLKAQLHQGSINISSIIKYSISGVFRGLLKNAMLNVLIAPFKLSVAFSLQAYPAFLGQTYLKEWWINQVIAKTFFASTPLLLLKNNPEKMISALWVILEIIEVQITNISKMIEIFAFYSTTSINQLIQIKTLSNYFNNNK